MICGAFFGFEKCSRLVCDFFPLSCIPIWMNLNDGRKGFPACVTEISSKSLICRKNILVATIKKPILLMSLWDQDVSPITLSLEIAL